MRCEFLNRLGNTLKLTQNKHRERTRRIEHRIVTSYVLDKKSAWEAERYDLWNENVEG
jgi:hypothetical protein